MVKYIIDRNEKEINIYGYDHCFNNEDIKDLWENHKILYLKNGIMAVWVEKRKGCEPLIHLMNEDDGHIFWSKKEDKCFASSWLDNYIQTLTELKSRIEKLL